MKSLGLLEKIVFWICCVNGFCAVFFGGLMMLFPVDTPLGLGALLPAMGKFPFQELFFQTMFWSGLALFGWNGGMNLLSTAGFLLKQSWAIRTALIAGIMMIVWCVVESIYLFNFLAVFYGIVGLVQIVLSVLVMKGRLAVELDRPVDCP
jgi:hypothetical protein